MISRSAARDIAKAYIANLSNSMRLELALWEKETIEKPFGWVFFYDSKSFVEFGDDSDPLAGNAPIIVDRRTGSIYETGTSKPIEYYIENYEKYHSPHSNL